VVKDDVASPRVRHAAAVLAEYALRMGLWGHTTLARKQHMFSEQGGSCELRPAAIERSLNPTSELWKRRLRRRIL